MRIAAGGALLATALIVAAPAQAQRAPAPGAGPSYNWVQADYSVNYFGSDDVRLKSRQGYRISTSLAASESWYTLVAFDHQDFRNDAAGFDFELEYLTAGLGLALPLSPSSHVIVNLTYESEEISGTGFDDGDADGIGYLIGIRSVPLPNTELTLTYKQAKYEFDNGDEDRYETIAALVAIPLDPTVDFTVGLEFADLEAESGSGTSQFDIENYRVGLRYRF